MKERINKLERLIPKFKEIKMISPLKTSAMEWELRALKLEVELQEAKKEIEQLRMENMTDEYNNAEAERFAPEYERQIKEPLEQENKRLREALKTLYKAVWDINYQESFPNCGVAECLEDEMRKAKEALNQTDLKHENSN